MTATNDEKKAADMTPQERLTKLAEIKRAAITAERAPRPTADPDPNAPRLAKELSEAERAEWLREHKRKFR
jgi:hypothetical protein